MPTETPSPAAPSRAAPPVQLSIPGFGSWALIDRHTGAIVGSPNLSAASDTMSLVKTWITADFLRRFKGTPDAKTMGKLTIMIRDSDNAAAEEFYRRNGSDESIKRMIVVCGLTESKPTRRRWSNTVVSARDVARLGVCLADGRAAGPRWTQWLLGEMREVRGEGDFGPRLAFAPAVRQAIAIKNGWLLRDEDRLWHISCVAVTEGWSLSVLLRYPSRLGFGYGRNACKSVGVQLKARLDMIP